jgi:hypothetical protein
MTVEQDEADLGDGQQGPSKPWRSAWNLMVSAPRRTDRPKRFQLFRAGHRMLPSGNGAAKATATAGTGKSIRERSHLASGDSRSGEFTQARGVRTERASRNQVGKQASGSFAAHPHLPGAVLEAQHPIQLPARELGTQREHRRGRRSTGVGVDPQPLVLEFVPGLLGCGIAGPAWCSSWESGRFDGRSPPSPSGGLAPARSSNHAPRRGRGRLA